MTLKKRREFLQLMSIGSVFIVLGDWGKKSLAQKTFQIPEIPQTKSSINKTLQILLSELETAKPNSILSVGKLDSANKTPEIVQIAGGALSRELENKTSSEVDALIESLNQVFSFNQKTGELTRNPDIKLDSGQENAVQKLISGFQQQLESNQITLERQSDNLFVPITEIPESTFTVPNKDTTQIEATNEAQRSCNAQWSRKTYWWGWRFTLNRCLLDRLRLILGGGATAAGIASIFGFPIVVAIAIAAVIEILDRFSNSNGVQIYITWVGVVVRITGA